MSYKPTVCFTPANLDGCGLWRMFIPHMSVENSGFFFTQGKVPLDAICKHDALCVQRLVTDGNIKFIHIMHKMGLRIVYDLDDNLWDLEKSNPAYAKLNKYLEGVVDIIDGEITRHGLKECIQLADVVTVSTDYLRRVVERELRGIRNVFTKKPIPVVTIENYVDTILFKPSIEENEQVVIGWGGSNTHQGDVGEVWDMLPDILEKYPNVRMEFVGMNPPTKILKHSRVVIRDWVHIAEYAQTMRYWNWDIFLAPLATNKFNRAKSCIKQLEAGAFGKPCLGSYVENYVKFAKSAGEKQTEPGNILWSICATPIQWKSRLEYLIENKQARLDLGARFREHTLNNYDMRQNSWRWQDACDLACQ